MQHDTPLQYLKGVGPKMAAKLKKLDLETIEDLLLYYPRTWLDLSCENEISTLRIGDRAVIFGKVTNSHTERSFKKRMSIIRAKIVTRRGDSITAVWFNQPFLKNMLQVDSEHIFYGKIDYDWQQKEKILLSPILEKKFSILAIYAETKGVTSRYLRKLVQTILDSPIIFQEFLADGILADNKLLSYLEAIKAIHQPIDDLTLSHAKYRLAFNELFLLALKSLVIKNELKKQKAPKISAQVEYLVRLSKSLPYKLTNAQRKASWEIIEDIKKPYPMNRLLQGDVGSGKTIVAVMAALNAIKNNHQVAWMAPTEILAHQHYETACKLLKDFDVNILLVTSNKVTSNFEENPKSQVTNPKQIPNPNIQIPNKLKSQEAKKLIPISDLVIGTHALIQEGIKFSNLGLVIIDEQHRFGVQQRAKFADRGLTQTGAQTNADKVQTNANEKQNSVDNNLLYKDLTYRIRGIIFKVRKKLGLGHKEGVYQKAIEEELIIDKFLFEREKIIDILYNKKKIGIYRPDFVIEEKIILELKSLPFIGKIEKRQVWQYLKGSPYKLALLVNFGSDDVEIHRLVYDRLRRSEHSLRTSATKNVPHFLSMTATPIPRTLALSIYGDLDISILDEMPAGRRKIITRLVDPVNRDKAYQFIREQIKEGRQAFVICPLIETKNEKLKTKNLFDSERKTVKQEYEKLSKEIFPDLKIGILHGKMKAKEKEAMMQKFKDNKINILVSTSVVEVGVDIPNATIMMIEDADRFGLAQLHQFRGRVGRSQHQSYCLLFTNSQSLETQNRLRALVDCHDGFKLAEKDLELRGPGELTGINQSGLPELKIASLTDIMLIRKTRNEAEKIIAEGLAKYPLLREKLEEFGSSKHLE